MDNRIALEELPPWAQELIFRTAAGLLEDSEAYAESTRWESVFRIKAHGFTYTAQKGARWIF